MKMLIEIIADGYSTKEEMEEACIEIVKDLDSTAVTVNILEVIKDTE